MRKKSAFLDKIAEQVRQDLHKLSSEQWETEVQARVLTPDEEYFASIVSGQSFQIEAMGYTGNTVAQSAIWAAPELNIQVSVSVSPTTTCAPTYEGSRLETFVSGTPIASAKRTSRSFDPDGDGSGSLAA